MRRNGSRSNTRKRTVSLTIDPELYAHAKSLGVNASQIAEEALTKEVARRRAEALAAEIRTDLDAANEYVNRNGSFADLARDHFAESGDDSV
jgi:post-segregation antitoxin (ccd killing protein)